ncbi:DNA methyltransferase [Gramella sp. GC03-9]|uniref:DNA methyltransferase n=1 Tax=Christiangramia oceanisediminis TaxID=2920386 RepID=A0A9X2KVB5_9FLAO|nr:DNA methyltransferase [Gramella oceanisediminis]MCP9199017.1 DNA methyltransferase [Gramella oceanisediminis]
MSRLTELIDRIKFKDPKLGKELMEEFKVISARRQFGLNFERHKPENVELPNRKIKKGDKVRILPERKSLKKGDQRLWLVKEIFKTGKKKVASIKLLDDLEAKTLEKDIDNLIVVAEFQDYIYPGLVSTGRLERNKDKPYHTVINGENFHALKALNFTHKGKIDVIYIDPPYNTGSRDWKYNNNYVEADDNYRHSKWLAFMERRLEQAKDLLNPDKSVLIVTIDEKEYLRLGMLLEQLFPGQRIQMVSSMINPKGSARGKEFYRVDEYIYFVYFGKQTVNDVLIPGLCVSNSKDNDENEAEGESKKIKKVRWASLLRSGSEAQREDSHLKFYPVLVDRGTKTIIDAGDPVPLGIDKSEVDIPKGLDAVWPIRSDGSDGRWQLNQNSFRKLLSNGHLKISSINKKSGKITFNYLMEGQRKQLKEGGLIISGKDKYGGIIVEYSDKDSVVGRPRTLWMTKAHSATEHGSSLIKKFIPGRTFPYPKSLYAVEDTLKFFVRDNPNAIILDFFAGSGTTAHAVMRLNRLDDGARQCISITNNEVSAEEQIILKNKGLRPGDKEWEDLGICEYITKPRIKAALTGKTPEGKKISGEYKFYDEFPFSKGFSENVEFFTLTYHTPIAIHHNLAYQQIAPLLWMRAGSQGMRIDKLPEKGWEILGNYALLVDLDKNADFILSLKNRPKIKMVFIVTNDDRRFQAIVRQLPDGVEAIRLYESYLKNFQFTSE